jgi:hypothetical protein
MQGWQGPFLCRSCHEKKEAMEGKRRSIGIDDLIGYLKYSVFTSTRHWFLLCKLLTCSLLLILCVQIHRQQMPSVTWEGPNCWNHSLINIHFFVTRIASQLTTQFFFINWPL